MRDVIELFGSCVTVVTSRYQLTRLRTEIGAALVVLEPMITAEASQLLAARLGDRQDGRADVLAALAELCGGLPHVITVLGQHIASRPTADLRAFATHLDRRQVLTEIGDDDDGSLTADALFSSTYQALDPPEQRLLRLLGMSMHREIGVDEACIRDGRPVMEVKRSLRLLVAAHLLIQPESFDRYRIHDLVREFARYRAEQKEPILQHNPRIQQYPASGAHSATAIVG